MLLQDLQPGVVVEEAQPLNQVVVLVDQLLALEKLEVLEFLLGCHEDCGALF